jgi:hypothetical protein
MANTGIYDTFKTNLFNGGMYYLSSGGDTIKVALMKDTFSFDASHVNWSDVSDQEIAATGSYTSGGKTLSGQSVSINNHTVTFSGDVTIWSYASFTAYACVIYDSSATNSPLICAFDFGSAKTAVNGNFRIVWANTGIISLS